MANQMSAINVNVDSDIKEQANNLFTSLGLNMSTAINMFLRKAINDGGIPFEVKKPKPNRQLLKALKEAEKIEKGKIKAKSYHSVEELIEDLENEI